jgi:FixJ family two-component response regulator
LAVVERVHLAANNMSDFGKKPKIIADRALLNALQTAVDGIEFTGDSTDCDDALIVYANATAPHIARRSGLGGLKRLQRILAHPDSEPSSGVVLGFTPASSLGSYQYLIKPDGPLSYIQLPVPLPLPDGQIAEPDAWRRLTRRASEEELELESANYRHRLQSIMAAARIYLGAAIVGQIKHLDYERVLNALQALARVQDPSITLDVNALADSLRRHERFHPDYKLVRRPHNTELWVLDDHWADHGWESVYAELPLTSVRGFTNWKSLEGEVLVAKTRPNVLLVDCNLGRGEPTGLELLLSIRSVWQDIRVVFVTAYDDAALALTSLREGANVFFAKALNDVNDRHSKDYYERLATVLDVSPLEIGVSELWTDFVNADWENSQKQGLVPGTVEPMLRLGFYLLFSSIDNNLWWRGDRSRFAEEHVFRIVLTLIKAGYPNIREIAQGEDQRVGSLLRRGPHERINFKQLSSVLNYVYCKVKSNSNRAAPAMEPWGRPWPDWWPYRFPKELQTDSSYPGLPVGTPIAAHELLEGQGAIELVRGAYCNMQCRHATSSIDDVLSKHSRGVASRTYDDVAVIDDRGNQSGWFAAVEAVFPKCRTYDNVETFLNAPSEANLLILDLRLPTLEAGMSALRRILEGDPSVPILTMSASTQYLAAIQSLRKGALDFISKTLPGARLPEACFLFADELRQKVNLLRRYGTSDCRKAFQRLHALRRNNVWEPSAFRVAQAQVNRCERYRNQSAKRAAWRVPPPPGVWVRSLAEEIGLLLHLRQQLYWLKSKKTSEPKKRRLDYWREYQIRSLDSWRWDYILSSKKAPDIVKLMAIVAGMTVEEVARWHCCLASGRALNPTDWAGREIIVSIEDATGSYGAFLWERRNDAIYQSRRQPQWDQRLADRLVTDVFQAVRSFGVLNGIVFP